MATDRPRYTVSVDNELFQQTDHITLPQLADRDMIREILGE